MSADDPVAVANLDTGSVVADRRRRAHVAVGAAEGRRSCSSSRPPPTDLERVAAHTDAFFQAVLEIDGFPLSLMRRLLPHEVVAFEMVVDERFDQSPGPDAGARGGGR